MVHMYSALQMESLEIDLESSTARGRCIDVQIHL